MTRSEGLAGWFVAKRAVYFSSIIEGKLGKCAGAFSLVP